LKSDNSNGECRRYSWRWDLSLSVYISFLFAWIEESRPLAWSNSSRYLYYWHPHAIALSGNDFILFYGELLFIPMLVSFVLLRLFNSASFTRTVHDMVLAIVVLAGFPLAWLLVDRRQPLLGIELIVAIICFTLWANDKWPMSSPPSVALLVIHYLIWSFPFWTSTSVIPWGRTWEIQNYLWSVIPLIGFCCTLLWARRLRLLHPKVNRGVAT
jgi:hypothetical protein